MTTDELHKEFEVELMALLRKYKAEMSVKEGWCGYANTVDGIDIDFESIYDREADELIRGSSTLTLSSTIFG